MSLSLSHLITASTRDEILSRALAVARTVGLNTSSWRPLGRTRTLFYLFSDLFAGWTSTMAAAAAGGLLDYATGDWLTLLAWNMFRVERIEATFATGTDAVELSNATAAPITVDVDAITVENSSTSKTYRNTTGGTIPAGGTLDVSVIADEIGADSDAAVGEIDTMVTTITGVTCTNTVAVLGTDEELDAALKVRCAAKLGALGTAGAQGAYEYYALSAKRSDGTTVNVNRVGTSATSGAVSVILASPSGAPTASDVTDVDEAIQSYAVPLGVTATVAAATEVSVPVTFTAYADAADGATDAEITSAIEAELVSRFKVYPIGGKRTTVGGQGYIYADEIGAWISEAHSAVFKVTVSAPASDTAIDDDEVAVLGTITTTITRVAQ